LTPIILASTSATRAAILRAAGVAFTIVTPGVDEGAIKSDLLRRGYGAAQVADCLAEMKALAVSSHAPDLVIGADQTLDLAGALMDKARTVDEARRRLLNLRGRMHTLHTTVVVAQHGAVSWREAQTAKLTMRTFSDDFLEGYMARLGDGALSSLGSYFVEGEGIQLFERIEGDYFAILGLPLLGLLNALRRAGGLAT
jgi:septum formation protein